MKLGKEWEWDLGSGVDLGMFFDEIIYEIGYWDLNRIGQFSEAI